MSWLSDFFNKLFHRHHKDQPNVPVVAVPPVPSPVPVETPAPVVPPVVAPVVPSPVPVEPPKPAPPPVVVVTPPKPPVATPAPEPVSSLPPTSMGMAQRIAKAKALGYNSTEYQSLLLQYGAGDLARLINLYSEQGNWGGAGIPFELSSQIRAYMLSHTSAKDFQ